MKNAIVNFGSTLALTFVLIAFSPSTAMSADAFKVTTIIKDHKFNPSEIKVPAGKKILLIVDNQDETLEEFDSQPLNRRNAIKPHEKGLIYFGPLEKGRRYSFIGVFHEKTAFGAVIAQ